MGITIYALAALAEILGCFAVWVVWRQGATTWLLVPGVASLMAFAWLLALSPADQSGRAFAGYGGIYIAASIVWLWLVEGRIPDSWDFVGAALCLLGAWVILYGPRS